MIFDVQDMSCGGCIASIEKAIKALDAKADVTGDLDKAQISVKSDIQPEAIRLAIEEAGFPAQIA